jgi:hypothetical protein
LYDNTAINKELIRDEVKEMGEKKSPQSWTISGEFREEIRDEVPKRIGSHKNTMSMLRARDANQYQRGKGQRCFHHAPIQTLPFPADPSRSSYVSRPFDHIFQKTGC